MGDCVSMAVDKQVIHKSSISRFLRLDCKTSARLVIVCDVLRRLFPCTGLLCVGTIEVHLAFLKSTAVGTLP